MKLGVIGYGSRIKNVIKSIQKEDSACVVHAIADIRQNVVVEGFEEGAVPVYSTPEAMLNAEQLDGILIGTRCSLHTEMALKVLPTGIPLFLEKPVATTMEDARRLKAGGEAGKSKVVVSFPLRVTAPVQLVKEIIDSGKIGTVEHVQAINNVPYGGVYFHNWYRDENETGGLFLQKATHDFDYIQYVLGLRPTQVCAMTSKQVFKGTKPAGLKCADCEENRTCPDSTVHGPQKNTSWAYCSFAEDTGNEDSGSALIRYETGMHVSYSQNFFARRSAGTRGARFIGYKGTVDFDFFTNEVKVIMHHTPRTETHRFESSQDHFGGDAVLARSFIDLMKGEGESISPLQGGLDSALLCLKARESAQTGTFQAVEW
ncbi:Gfo/Idh/MocA family protein [Paenibacillus ginsengarvi]|uniref:Gfo/Idh/MocA family oxidoreductase n=1 Tax=Paenibacillus ginsengarvi TaxID=400777 RepID=A0A3B0AZL1_9BACL|nr:Gfo/Idh/MocA family oxidoreductase [Paenibacillus ginsengarvi]RKN65496.1 gfo/Idh/MocA family oxidoreductase [Paenibacillus ginsengarvi]